MFFCFFLRKILFFLTLFYQNLIFDKKALKKTNLKKNTVGRPRSNLSPPEWFISLNDLELSWSPTSCVGRSNYQPKYWVFLSQAPTNGRSADWTILQSESVANFAKKSIKSSLVDSAYFPSCLSNCLRGEWIPTRKWRDLEEYMVLDIFLQNSAPSREQDINFLVFEKHTFWGNLLLEDILWLPHDENQWAAVAVSHTSYPL